MVKIMIILTGDRYKSRPNILSKEEIDPPRSDHSSTSDSESARLSSAIAERLSGETDHAGAGLAGVGGGVEGGPQGGHDGRPPARGEVRMANQGPPLSR